MATMALSASWKALVASMALSWTVRVAGDKAAGDYFVHSLPGAPEGPLLKMHAGHIEVSPDSHGNLFFWHFQNRHIANRQRTVIWINGGPGCSSEDGALMEIGPYRLKDEQSLRYNDGSWNEFANIMFVDNPVGTGFSYVDTNKYLEELDDMADNFITFLEKFFTLWPEYEHDDLFIAGESYAGQHIPYIAKHILKRNDKPDTKHKWKLTGLLIGNGWVSPKEQYESYLQFAYAKNLIQKNSDVANEMEKQLLVCQRELAIKPNSLEETSCEAILQYLLQETSIVDSKGDRECFNMYDVRLRDTFPSCGMNWPPDLKSVTPYLRRKEVVEALHVNPAKASGWKECSGQVGGHFRPKKAKPSVHLLPELLAQVPVLLFSGAEDLICNHLGTEAFIGNMQWNGGKGLEVTPGTWAPRRDWTFEGENAGFWQEARNLTYVLFYNSSHMVPFDYARRTRDMLDRFMGIDISSIGGQPTDSRLDGEKGPQTAVGGLPGGNATTPEQQTEIDKAKWAAYRKSGEVVLIIVVIVVTAWAYFVWRDRRRHAGYLGVLGSEPASTSILRGGRGTAMEGFRMKRNGRDIEAADLDESELDDLRIISPTDGAQDDRYSVGGASDDEDGAQRHEMNQTK